MKIGRKKNWIPACAGTTMLLIVACATFGPGDDPKGQELKEPAGKVLVSLEAFKAEKGRYPNSLYELVPKYLEKIPDEPSLRLDEYSSTLRFAYTREWPQVGRIICVATLGTIEWRCEEYQ